MEYENMSGDKEHLGKEMPMGHESVDLPMSMMGGNAVKPGDEIVFRVDAVKGDMVTMSYAPAKGHEDEEPEDMHGKSEEEMHKMPLDKMEKSLPHAEREGY